MSEKGKELVSAIGGGKLPAGSNSSTGGGGSGSGCGCTLVSLVVGLISLFVMYSTMDASIQEIIDSRPPHFWVATGFFLLSFVCFWFSLLMFVGD